WMEDHDGRPQRVFREALRFLSVEQKAVATWTDGGALLVTERNVRGHQREHPGAHHGLLGALLNHFFELVGAEGAGGSHDVERLDQAGLALPVVAGDDVEARRRREVDGAQIAKAADGDLLEADAPSRNGT